MTNRLAAGSRLVLATHNPGKAREVAQLLEPWRIDVATAGSLGLPEPEETGASFEENALLKAVSAARLSGMPALADDSGLAIDALDGAPGIHSARWAQGDFEDGMRRLHQELEARAAPQPWTARFYCALALVWPGGEERAFLGKVEGRCVWPPRGERGFGYDPMFLAEGESETFGEMAPARKDSISHRADAFAQLARACLEA